jgi:glutamate formiminotransferase
MSAGLLLAVPNVSEGEDGRVLDRLAEAFGARATVLDRSADALHGRAVFTLAAAPADLGAALLEGASVVIEAIDLRRHGGEHPRIGALDVCPVVYHRPEDQEDARRLAVDVAGRLGALGLPVFLYGELAQADERRERHFFRRGGPEELARRMADGGLPPDFGPAHPHPSAGAVLVTARPPLAAFNVELEGADIEAGRQIATDLRESGGGLPGVRAIAIDAGEGRVQISTNVHDPVGVPLAQVVAEIERLAASQSHARPVAAELIGLVPEAALEGYPADVPIRDFDPGDRTIEPRLAALR